MDDLHICCICGEPNATWGRERHDSTPTDRGTFVRDYVDWLCDDCNAEYPAEDEWEDDDGKTRPLW